MAEALAEAVERTWVPIGPVMTIAISQTSVWQSRESMRLAVLPGPCAETHPIRFLRVSGVSEVVSVR